MQMAIHELYAEVRMKRSERKYYKKETKQAEDERGQKRGCRNRKRKKKKSKRKPEDAGTNPEEEGAETIEDRKCRLERYEIPDSWIFDRITCPHYTAEILIYAAVGSRHSVKHLCSLMYSISHVKIQGMLMSSRLYMSPIGCGSWIMCMGWVATNLGITACKTEEWYKQRFGDKCPRNRWRILPGLF